MEKANMPTFWKNPEDAQFWTPGDEEKRAGSYVKTRTVDDTYTSLPSPSKGSRQGNKLVDSSHGVSARDARAQRAAELQRRVAELDLQDVDQSIVGVQDHDYGYEDERYERAALIHQHQDPASTPDRAFRHLDSPGKDDDKHPELTQYHAPTVQLANVPSLTYDHVDTPRNVGTVDAENETAAHVRPSSRTAPGVGAFGIASWFGWNNTTHPHEPQQQMQQRTAGSAADGYLRPGEAYGADAQPRTPDGEGTNWWRNYWDRVSYAGSHEPSVVGMEEDEKETLTTQPAVMRQVNAGSWGVENARQQHDSPAAKGSSSRPLPAPPALKIDTREHAGQRGETSLDSAASPSSHFSPHADSPLSRLIQSSRDSFSSLSRDEAREHVASSSSPSNLSPRKGDTQPTANATIRAVTATSRPTVAPRASSFAASSKQASPVAEVEDAPEMAAKTLPPAIGPKGKLFNLVLPSPLSPARYPYGKEGDVALTKPAVTAVEVKQSGTSTHQPRGQINESNEGGGTVKWANQRRPQKPSPTEPSLDATPIQLPKGKNVITVGGMSLAQAKAAREKAEAEALTQKQEQSRPPPQQPPMPVASSAPKSILLESTSKKGEGKLTLPAPSRFAVTAIDGGEDPYLAGRSAWGASFHVKLCVRWRSSNRVRR
ncbi:hypothetical protein [Sporisorium scitamineum]|uniref:Uncharacterized protein n=1 Tax=Sporisorium scitamineum TaxID=49012 RepID=A0A0F7S618_9BASI|nr:hypothetical protein [Sporisorium scitamineum]